MRKIIRYIGREKNKDEINMRRVTRDKREKITKTK